MSQALLVIANAALPVSVSGDARSSAVELVDITIEGETIGGIAPAGSARREGTEVRDLDGGLVLPAFVDVHTHLDKGHIWSRKANPDGTWMGALMSVLEDRESNWSAADVARRRES